MLLGRVCWRKSENFVQYECINMIVSTWLVSALHEATSHPMLPIPEGTSSRDCWNTKLCDWLNFSFAVQRNWWDKVWNVSMTIFPFVGSRSWISLVGTAYLSVCMFVCLVCLLLSVYSNGWACHMSTHILFCCVQTGFLA
jgi:hypothetical protein